MILKNIRNIFFVLLIQVAWLIPSSVTAQTTVFLKPAEALKIIFKDSQEVYKEDHVLNPAQIQEFQEAAGYTPPKTQYSFYLGKTHDQIDAYALIDEQVGKVLPITFISRISPQGKVESVEVMVYRESHGGEVKNRRFLNQFVGKSPADPLKLQRDIVNVSGATLSSQAMAVGVKRALTLWNIFYGKHPAPSPQT